ncbi:cation transporter [Halalkalibacillus sediminis]|uniref:Cation transporter n=1 Tax=Halalkalibacillus sediminis TaxID=2018042 RepID=A0A2I0QTK3_9BACI|nr:sodium:calcium antiporter [Halalkalibacillus sediminis]PKR77634.1 cation transporter [Halalkalibacillus sediminis]
MTWIYISIFVVSGIVSALAAVQLSKHADTISRLTNIGGVLAGTILLATATSLPELTTTISASLIGNADIAVGNGFGSVLFNIFMLFLLDIYFRNKRLFLNVSHSHIYTGVIGLLLCGVSAVSLALNLSLSFSIIGLTSIAIALIYTFGMWFISKVHKTPEDEDEQHFSENPSVRHSIKYFILYGIVILVFGSALSISGDAISQNTAISASAVGSILVAFATSIPDALGVFTALKLGNVNLAIGAILGSNVFNILVIAIGDIFYFDGNIWGGTSSDLVYVAIAGFILTALVMIIIKRDHARNSFTYVLPSLAAIITYLIAVGIIFM